MWTPDMSRCPGCGDKNNCTDRKKIAQTLSTLTNDLNSDAEFDGPGDGIIIVACQYRAPA